MMKSEFVKILKANSSNTDVADKDYKIIEHVYNYHPAINDKVDIVKLYLDYGMTVIKDMQTRANECQKLEDAIHQKQNELEVLRNKLADCRE